MSSMKKEENADPDYDIIQEESVGEVNESLQREDARDQAIHKIQNIIHEQVSFEIDIKENEVSTLNRRVHECQTSLDRLRACILAGYYGYGTTPTSIQRPSVSTGRNRTSLKESNLHDIMNWKRSLPSNLKEQEPDQNLSSQNKTTESQGRGNKANQGKVDLANLIGSDKPDSLTGNESRFYVKRKIIVGNTSKYILPEQREGNDRSTHKWMVYVRGPKDDGELQNFISKVWFLLHPSYKPNDLVEVCKPPFQVTRRGWGEFPVRVQLHFVENKNKRVDIIHHLKLDKTYTGLQTLGAETHVEIEVDRKNFDGSSLCQAQDSNRNNTTSSAEVLVQNPCCKVEENMEPVSSKSFDLASGHNGMAMDCESMKIDQKGSKQDKYGSQSEYGILSDHSYSSVMAEKPLHQDDMKYPATSMSGPRCSSPKRGAGSPKLFSLESKNGLLMQNCVELFPVVRAEKCLNKPGYCASSLEAFLGWNLGKRLAAEWQRALAMKAHMENERAVKSRVKKEHQALVAAGNIKKEKYTLSMLSQKESEVFSLSTKEVMNYCRMHGYTPMVESLREGNSLCKYCGEETNESDLDDNQQPVLAHEECVLEFEEDSVSETCTTAEEFLETLSKSERISKKPDENLEDEGVVDVVGVAHEGLTKDPSKPRLCFLPVTLEHEWVQEIARQVDVVLTNSDIDGVHAPVTSAMLYKACTMFVEDIVRKANRFTWKSSLRIPKAKCILPYHVKQALEVIPHCDFLTNHYLNVEIDATED